ncbi:MAG: thermonuclease family protein, partial [Actinomycetota bacterium]|nr:thermonuclease family protein [Actinomycetota bacterium]
QVHSCSIVASEYDTPPEDVPDAAGGRAFGRLAISASAGATVPITTGTWPTPMYPPNDRHEDRLHDAEARARDESRGLWSAC